MAQTNYTPISLYYSTTASAVPLNTNLVNGELAINITDGKLYYKDNTGTVQLLAGTGGAGIAAGSNTQIQYNNSGAFGASASLTFDGTTFSAPNSVITSSSSSNALRITQTGTGSALLVEDSANPDATPFLITSSGIVIVGFTGNVGGADTRVPNLQITGTSNNASTQGLNAFSASATVFPALQFNKSATAGVGAQAIVTNNAALGTIQFSGSDGTNFIQAATISSFVDGTPGTNDMPGRLVFSTTADGAATPTERLRIDNAGLSTFTGTAVINANTTTEALRVTQAGSGDALVIEDSATPDATPFKINSAGNISTYGTILKGYSLASSVSSISGNLTPEITAQGTTAAASFLALNNWQNSSTAAAGITLTKSKSAAGIGFRGAVVSGDNIGSLNFSSDDGTNFVLSGYIAAQADANATTGIAPGRLIFATTNSSGVTSEAMRITSAGIVNIAGLTASKTVFTDSSKNLTSTGTVGVDQGGTGQTTYTDGQLLIGNSTGNTLTKTTLTAGSGVSISNGSGSITISATGSGGTVTSVAQTFTGGLISVGGSPITGSGTLALTVAGTSGGIPYFSSGTTWASSAALAANALVVGGGAGSAPATVTTGTGVVTALGVNTGSAGAFVVNGGALGTPSSGTVTNLTGTASININGTVGATTANTGAFTNLTATSLGVGTAASGTAGEIRATNNVTAYYSSDARLKENIRDIPFALEKAMAIGGKLFDWTDDYINQKGGEDGYFVRKEDFGVIAQDVEKHLPVAVRVREDGTLAVNYEKLCALAFAAIRELKKEIDAMRHQ
jgi:hypothetical protein